MFQLMGCFRPHRCSACRAQAARHFAPKGGSTGRKPLFPAINTYKSAAAGQAYVYRARAQAYASLWAMRNGSNHVALFGFRKLRGSSETHSGPVSRQSPAAAVRYSENNHRCGGRCRQNRTWSRVARDSIGHWNLKCPVSSCFFWVRVGCLCSGLFCVAEASCRQWKPTTHAYGARCSSADWRCPESKNRSPAWRNPGV